MSDTKYEVTVTAIIFRQDGRMLITKRSQTKKRYPGLWTVPGGHVEPRDYNTIEPNKDGVWYSVLDKTVKREVYEEVGLAIKNPRYLTDMVLDGTNSVLVISMIAEYAGGNVELDFNESSASYG